MFVWGALLCTAVEYAAGRYLLAVYGLRWWDYSRLPLNLDGLVSPLSSALFGLGCCAVVYFAGPLLAGQIDKISPRRQTSLCLLLLVLYGADNAYSAIYPNVGEGITESGQAAQAGWDARCPAESLAQSPSKTVL